jgi:hypothetical protein
MRRRAIPAPEPEPEPEPDFINNSPHYDGLACLRAIEVALGREQYIGFLRGQVIKYNWRFGRKGDDGEQAEKAKFYQDEIVRVVNKEA